jgi:8-oxo-dGTP pyrophosphatase MutT (NUDIX family)
MTQTKRLPDGIFSADPKVDMDLMRNAPAFISWMARLDPRFNVTKLHFDSASIFTIKGEKKVGFIKFTTEVFTPAGDKIGGGIVPLMRGGSVAMLPVFVCGRRFYTALAVQPRLPTAVYEFEEVPAGSVDGGSFKGAAAREIEEELHMSIPEDRLIEIGSARARESGIFLTPGGSDEMMHFYVFIERVSKEWLAEVNGRCTGLLEEHEQITLKIVPLSTLIDSNDAKTIVAYALFQNARRKGLIKIPA